MFGCGAPGEFTYCTAFLVTATTSLTSATRGVPYLVGMKKEATVGFFKTGFKKRYKAKQKFRRHEIEEKVREWS